MILYISNSAISNFKSYINATRVKEEKKNDALLNREPKGEFWTIEPAIYTLDEAVIKVRSSSDNDSDKDSDYQAIKDSIAEVTCDVGKMKEQSNTYTLMFSTIKNEVFHRRAISLLDSKKELSNSEVKNMKVE